MECMLDYRTSCLLPTVIFHAYCNLWLGTKILHGTPVTCSPCVLSRVLKRTLVQWDRDVEIQALRTVRGEWVCKWLSRTYCFSRSLKSFHLVGYASEKVWNFFGFQCSTFFDFSWYVHSMTFVFSIKYFITHFFQLLLNVLVLNPGYNIAQVSQVGTWSVGHGQSVYTSDWMTTRPPEQACLCKLSSSGGKRQPRLTSPFRVRAILHFPKYTGACSNELEHNWASKSQWK